jgi:transcriptional regulator with XRE-family HTH domain
MSSVSALAGVKPGLGSPHAILYPRWQRVGPLRDRLGLDADCQSGTSDGPSQEGERGLLVHATLNHAFPTTASIVYAGLRKVPTMEFGDRLTKALAIANESRDGLAKALGISVQAISQVINGITKAMTAENTLRAARHLRVSAWWLATGEGSPQGVHVLRDTLSDEAVSYGVEFDAMTETEREQFKMLLAVAIEGRRHLGGVSKFDEIAEG